ncbi:MAG: RNA polymerase-binding protein DksA [Nitrospinae bacterium RIFCSPLOWO2_02_39_17]|nr:MAG: RNA polymerase-binding protein DksA [Nitrospinae bacterium RIFCSPHIGHO2_02_39_11]OGV99026.1 MAG: RNA polymerase-binding protein DksA [Nitrospinae bacterium RIFCSPHIGHO2_12_FULL_39_42]OGW04741.1 MAG: RNA polymerase-binding protein DksA [Nitrospinae bacterium RIFCSPLOWO2_02_39_17]OGW10437.1 MAG: RNA polymerase-binding protein DksA [Nitrospinae bacterium RIFCSPLOWO2_12_39_15]
MDQKNLDYFKEELLKQRQDILTEAAKTVNENLVVAGEELSDTIDRSSIESDRNFTLRLRDRERKLLKKIDEALERIESKTFGICEECGEGIGVNRLKVRPVATLCIACKEEQEKREKMIG